MSLDLQDVLVIGISSRALFDLELENQIYENEGLEKYSLYQQSHEHDILKPGTGFNLAKAFLKINELSSTRKIEIVIMSKNSADTSMRIFNSINHYGLDISRAALVGGHSISPYLQAFRTDLFLSADENDVEEAINSNIASAIICTHPEFHINPEEELNQIKIAFDGDAVIFSEEAELIYKNEGLEAFVKHEVESAANPLPEGPFAKLLKTLSFLQNEFPHEDSPIRTALVTARNLPAHERVVKTLESWNVKIDEAFFLGGMDKGEVLKAFGANIFFDDQLSHIESASRFVSAARVPYKKDSQLHL